MYRLYDTARGMFRRGEATVFPEFPLLGDRVPPLWVLHGHKDSIASLAFLPDGSAVLSGSYDGSVRAWTVEDGREVGTVMKEAGGVVAITASSDGQWIATGGQANAITLWDAATHRKVVELKEHSKCVRSLAFSSDSTRAVSGSDDGTVIVWSMTTGNRLVGSPLKGHTNWVQCITFSPDGNNIASCDARDIRIWNSYSGALVIAPIEVDAVSLAWTPHITRLIAGCLNGAIKFIDSLTGLLPAECDGHDGVVISIAVSPNGKFIASGSWDHRIRLWDVATCTQIGPTLRFYDDVNCVAISPDGSLLAGGGDDNVVRIWTLSSILPPYFLENMPTSNGAPTTVHSSISYKPLLFYSPLLEVQDRPSTKADHTKLAENGKAEGVVTAVQTRPNGSSATIPNFSKPAQKEIASFAEAPLSMPPPLPPKFMKTGKGQDHGPSHREAQYWKRPKDADKEMDSAEENFEGVNTPWQKPPSDSPLRRNFPNPEQQEVLASAERDLSQPPPPPPKIIVKANDAGPSILAKGNKNARLGSNVVKNSAAVEQVAQDNAWNLDGIRSGFPNDLTDYVVRVGEDPITSGSYGDIYRGTFRVSGKSIDVAVKAIRTYSTDDGNDARKKKRLRREIKVWLNLKHTNVLPLFGTTMGFGRFPAMVCPWLKDGTLTSYLERCDDSLTAGQRLVLVGDVATGLQYLHSQSVVHGDLSGSNVLIHDNGRACIADFGLSTLLTELGGSTFATSFQARGTLRWAAPELLDLVPENDANPVEVVPTLQSDVYSFGGIMLHVLSGKVPYHYYSREGQVIHAISKGEIPRRPNQALVTEPQWTFIRRCWASVESRACDEEIVEFTRHELVQAVFPVF